MPKLEGNLAGAGNRQIGPGTPTFPARSPASSGLRCGGGSGDRIGTSRGWPGPVCRLRRGAPHPCACRCGSARHQPWHLVGRDQASSWLACHRNGQSCGSSGGKRRPEPHGHKSASYPRRVIPVTTHARPRALQYKATMTRTKACCNVALRASARSATARPSCTE